MHWLLLVTGNLLYGKRMAFHEAFIPSFFGSICFNVRKNTITNYFMKKKGGGRSYLMIGLFDLGNAISLTGFKSHVLHSLEEREAIIQSCRLK